jgi:hypothetical protein
MTQINASQREEMKRLGLGGIQKVQFHADHFPGTWRRSTGSSRVTPATRLSAIPLFTFRLDQITIAFVLRGSEP